MSTPSLFNSESDEPQLAPAERAAGGRTSRGLEVCVLGSGSGGNSTVVRCGDDAILIDAGFGPVTTAKRLGQAGLSLAGIKAIVLTHLDQDHFRPTWTRTLLGWQLPVYCHAWHRERMLQHPVGVEMIQAKLARTFTHDPFELSESMTVRPVALKHDQQGTFAFHVEAADGARMGYATELGHVPDELTETFAGVDLLAIESNYDPPMQLRSNRPLFLQRRIMGHAGHLSNEQAFECVAKIDGLSGEGNPQHILLLHRSQQCNHRDKVREVFEQSPDIWKRVKLTEQRRRSRWFKVKPQSPRNAAQMNLTF